LYSVDVRFHVRCEGFNWILIRKLVKILTCNQGEIINSLSLSGENFMLISVALPRSNLQMPFWQFESETSLLSNFLEPAIYFKRLF
jgi:hypothetical protein